MDRASAFCRFLQAGRAPVDLTISVMANSHAILLVAAVALAAIFIGSAEAKKPNVCPKWYKDCNPRKPGCETRVESDVNNCGDCRYKCKTLPYAWTKCVGGQCRYTCKAGRGDCDKKIWRNGCETNIKNDANNCGSCGKPCKQVANAVTSCLNGKCRDPVCKSGYANCDKKIWSNGCETRVAKDVNNCGACSNVCKQVANAVTSCQNGKCGTPVCKAGWSNCDANWANGCETPTSEDPANCGACSNVCTQYPNAVTPCRSGSCDYGSITCKAGFNNCNSPVMAPDGCETENLSDVNNCGACYNVCRRTLEGSEVSCSQGQCEEQCPSGQVPSGNKCVTVGFELQANGE
ncbi:hypothetical protein M758_2G108700 [Ceratodon purpureus]|nr:hypothetical protein M758_2G108700 [Ceratodon purpureus]